MSYDHKAIEKKWQKYWAKHNVFNTTDDPENQNFTRWICFLTHLDKDYM